MWNRKKVQRKVGVMSKCRVLWEQKENGEWKWRCTRFLLNNGVNFRAEAETCYHYQCRGRSERRVYDQAPVEILESGREVAIDQETQVPICAWYRCDQPVAPNKLRHCSEVCRKRQNRWDYKQRKKKEREQAKKEQ